MDAVDIFCEMKPVYTTAVATGSCIQVFWVNWDGKRVQMTWKEEPMSFCTQGHDIQEVKDRWGTPTGFIWCVNCFSMGEE